LNAVTSRPAEGNAEQTHRNDARGIAQLVRLGWFRQVYVKSEEARRTRMLLVNRQQLLTKALGIENSVPGSLKVFGLRVGVVARRGFEARALELVTGDPILLAITEPMLRVRQELLEEFERLDRLCQQLARRDPVCRRLMTVPGVGVVAALTAGLNVSLSHCTIRLFPIWVTGGGNGPVGDELIEVAGET
jgi:transposase